MAEYKVKDVITSIRHEYQDHVNQLNGLKKFVDVKGKKEASFYECKRGNDKFVVLNIKDKNILLIRAVKNAFRKLRNVLTNAPEKKAINISYPSKNEKRFVVLPTSNDYSIGVSDQNRLFAHADRIMDSDFSDNINGMVSDLDNIFIEFENNRLTIRVKDTGSYPACEICYIPSTDQITIEPFYDSLYLDQLTNILETSIPEEKLPTYHRIIAKKNSSYKPLAIKGMTDRIHEHVFAINENDENIVLERVKK